MTDPKKASRPPLVLIANDQEWAARALQNILLPNGYAVLWAGSFRDAREQVFTAAPDIVIIEAGLSGDRGLELCRSLRDDPRVSGATALLVSSVGAALRPERLAAFRAGAWDFLGMPIDAEELLLKLGTYFRAKIDVDRVREESLIDEETGLYNLRGLVRRANEIAAQAERHHRPLACIVVAPDMEALVERHPAVSEKDLLPEAIGEIARIVRERCRVSDVVGRLRGQFVVLAPDTDESGARTILRRVHDAVETATAESAPTAPPLLLRLGYYAVPDFGLASLDPMELLTQATRRMHGDVNAESTESPAD